MKEKSLNEHLRGDGLKKKQVKKFGQGLHEQNESIN
jgi:hypothetical protein